MRKIVTLFGTAAAVLLGGTALSTTPVKAGPVIGGWSHHKDGISARDGGGVILVGNSSSNSSSNGNSNSSNNSNSNSSNNSNSNSSNNSNSNSSSNGNSNSSSNSSDDSSDDDDDDD